ncbi:MAG: hypothetical protein R6V32_09030 [Bacteroidales bacterium]
MLFFTNLHILQKIWIGLGFIFAAFVTIFAEKAKIPPKGGSGVFVYPGLRSVNLPHPGYFVFDPFRVGGMVHYQGVSASSSGSFVSGGFETFRLTAGILSHLHCTTTGD